MGTHATIRLERATKRFALGLDGELTAVEDVSLEVYAGEFVSVVGPSGCGKSTLLGMISGVLPSTAGRILVEGEEEGAGAEVTCPTVSLADSIFDT